MISYKNSFNFESQFWLVFYQRILFKVIWQIYFLLLNKADNVLISCKVTNKLRLFTFKWTYYKLIDIYRRNWYYIFIKI